MDRDDDVLGLRRAGMDGAPGLVCVVKCGIDPADVSYLRARIAASASGAVSHGRLGPEAAAWFAA